MTTRKWLYVVAGLVLVALTIHGTAKIALVALFVLLLLANLAYDRWGSKGTGSP